MASEDLLINLKHRIEIFKIWGNAFAIEDSWGWKYSISAMQVKHITADSAFSVACDVSWDFDDTAQVVLLGRCVNSEGPKQELMNVLLFAGQTRGKIPAAVIEYLT